MAFIFCVNGLLARPLRKINKSLHPADQMLLAAYESPIAGAGRAHLGPLAGFAVIWFGAHGLTSPDKKKIIDCLRFIVLAGLLWLPAVAMVQRADWKDLDLQKDTVFGISTSKAYELVKGKKHRTVVVAVIDGGTDTVHEDL